jgi:hypothetical protein
MSLSRRQFDALSQLAFLPVRESGLRSAATLKHYRPKDVVVCAEPEWRGLEGVLNIVDFGSDANEFLCRHYAKRAVTAPHVAEVR